MLNHEQPNLQLPTYDSPGGGISQRFRVLPNYFAHLFFVLLICMGLYLYGSLWVNVLIRMCFTQHSNNVFVLCSKISNDTSVYLEAVPATVAAICSVLLIVHITTEQRLRRVGRLQLNQNVFSSTSLNYPLSAPNIHRSSEQ